MEQNNEHEEALNLSDQMDGKPETNEMLVVYPKSAWLPYAVVATIFFIFNNEALVIVTEGSKQYCTFYWASGCILAGFVWNMFYACRNFKRGHGFWHNQNLKVNG